MKTQERGRPDYAGNVIAACALLVTAMVAYRQFVAPPPRQGASVAPTASKVDNWDALLADRPAEGPADAAVKIVEFADFECPACRGYVAVLDSLQGRYPKDVAIFFAHYPIGYHRFATPAARASECARSQGRFREMHHALYKKQDSLGLKSWRSFAEEAGVKNAEAFDACTASGGQIPGLARDTILAGQINLRGTPTIVVNGLKWSGSPSLALLDSLVRNALANSR